MCGLWIADDYKIMALQEQLPWLRLYVSVLNCPKVQRLPAPLFKHWINLLCVARSQDGILPGIADIAFALRIDVAEAEFGRDRPAPPRHVRVVVGAAPLSREAQLRQQGARRLAA